MKRTKLIKYYDFAFNYHSQVDIYTHMCSSLDKNDWPGQVTLKSPLLPLEK